MASSVAERGHMGIPGKSSCS
uniref:Uncharacterized protein n=1 Tax=Rhizophora mucronata TaxID=61149 RepID=A0A2P2QX19_RHIMU